jgi:hypothetical protein
VKSIWLLIAPVVMLYGCSGLKETNEVMIIDDISVAISKPIYLGVNNIKNKSDIIEFTPSSRHVFTPDNIRPIIVLKKVHVIQPKKILPNSRIINPPSVDDDIMVEDSLADETLESLWRRFCDGDEMSDDEQARLNNSTVPDILVNEGVCIQK